MPTWRDLLQTGGETLVSPWIGGRSLRSGSRHWRIEGRLPEEHGWAEFSLDGRKARLKMQCDPTPDRLEHIIVGYLVGDRLVPMTARAVREALTPVKVMEMSERVHLIDPGLDRFVRVSAGRMYEDGPLIYIQQEMPLGPEGEVQAALLDGKTSVADIKEVTPALDAAFYLEAWQRAEAEKRRQELAERRRLEEEARQREARRRELVERLGDGAVRREMAQHDFAEAARAALAIGGAEYLDHRRAVRRNEMVVQFRLDGRRFECTCDARTLQIIDSGICLTAHYDDPDFEGGTKGDTFFTLESLPAVILQAERERRLVVYRHLDD